MLPVHCDVTKEADVEAMIAGRSTSSAGSTWSSTWPASPRAMLTDVTIEHYDRTMDINLRGVLLGMKHGIRAMLDAGNGGAIVNWSSIGGLNASIATSVYARGQGGRHLPHQEPARSSTARKGIRVNAICPGYIQTEIMGATRRQTAGRAKARRCGGPREDAGSRRGRRASSCPTARRS